MQLRLVTVALDPETGEFPTDPLAAVEGEILNVVEHFFHHGGLPYLLLVVHHRPPVDGERRRRSQSGKRPADDLAPDDRRLFEKLRAWRQGRAETDAVPVYVVSNNRQLAAIASRRPKTLEQLREVEGIGESKAARYGRDILRLVAEEADEVVRDAVPSAAEHQEAADGS